MLEYELLKPLFEFLVAVKKHRSDNSSWTMAKFMHQVVMRATKATILVTHYIVLSCDEVFTIDNQF